MALCGNVPAPDGLRRGRAGSTAAHLVAGARDLFAGEGFANVSLEAVVNACGLTKGALYHHFRNKRELFTAVYHEEQRRLAEATAAACEAEADARIAVRAGWAAFLDRAAVPGVQQILLLDAPSILGWARTREISRRRPVAVLERALRRLEEVAPSARTHEPAVLALMVHGALCQGALLIAQSDDPAATRAAVDREIAILFDAALASTRPDARLALP